MLETCTNLDLCEKALVKAMGSVNIIGDLPLSSADIERLNSLLHSESTRNDLTQIAPNCLACGLVFAVHRCAEESDYWPSVNRTFGFEQERLRKFFDTFLLRSSLGSPGKQQIPLIFLHAGISPRDLGDFLIKMVMPLVKEGRVTTFATVKELLTTIRREVARPQRVVGRARSIATMVAACADLPASVEHLQAVEEWLTLEQEAVTAEDFGENFTHNDAMITVYQQQLNEIKAEMAAQDGAKLAELLDIQAQILSGYEALLQEVAISGGGDVEIGQRRIAAWREARRTADDHYAELAGSIPELPKLIEFVRELKVGKQVTLGDPVLLHEEAFSEMQGWADNEANDEDSEEGNGITALEKVPRPVARYLIHGGESAEHLLHHCILLVRDTVQHGIIDRDLLERLPPYLAQPFRHWWAGQRTFSPQVSVREERFQTPWIQLNLQTYRPELIFPAQSCKVFVGRLILVIILAEKDDLTEQEFMRVPLDGRRRGNGLVETTQRMLALTPEFRQIKLCLYDGDLRLREWDVSFQTASLPYPIFDSREGRLCPSIRQIKRVWLMLPTKTSLNGQGYEITREVEMDGQWSGYQLLELDLAGLQELYVVQADHTRYQISGNGGNYFEVLLDGTVSQIGTHLEDYPLYMGAMPKLELRYEDKLAVDAATLAITVDSTQQTFQWLLRECLPFAQQRLMGKVYSLVLDLTALLGGINYGCIRLSLTNLPVEDWYQVFCQVPALNARFDAPIYLFWQEAKPPLAQLKLEVPSYAEFVAHAPAQSHQLEAGLWDVKVSLAEDEILGNLRWSEGDCQFDIPLAFEIPKLLWLLSGEIDSEDGWFQERQREELWLDDWEGLAEQGLWIKVPAYVQGEIILTSPELPARKERRPIIEQMAKFDLAAWRAVLGEGKAVKELHISHQPPNAERAKPYFHQMLVCSVRSVWEAQNIGCMQMMQGKQVKLRIGWVEKGKAEERKLYLWRSTGELALEQLLEPRVYNCEAELKNADLLPGSYLIQLAAVDPWSEANPIYPGVNGLSTLKIEIVAAQDLHQDEITEIQAVVHAGHWYNFSRPYRVRIIGRIIGQSISSDLKLDGVVVKTSNQNWYWGELLESGDGEYDAEIRASNPIKFPESLVNSGKGAIEDRDGEGAMYCLRCRQLHWQQKQIVDPQHAPNLRGPISNFRRKRFS